MIRLRHALLGLVLAASATAPAFAQNSASVSTPGSITVFRPITITKNSNLSFGTVVRPNPGGGTGTVKVDQTTTNCDRTLTGAGFLLTTNPNVQAVSSCATFTVQGEGGQAFSIQVPANFNMSNGAATLQVILTPSALSANLGGNLGDVANGQQTFKVGGEVQISDSTTSGQYTGSFTTTVQYN